MEKSEFEWFILTLEFSLRRYGHDKKIRLGHLLNICKWAKQRHSRNQTTIRPLTLEDLENFELLLSEAKMQKPTGFNRMKETLLKRKYGNIKPYANG